ncbi:hypothetical protein jhhlp_005037 [Lomentospora prolificans]|uniref:Uncharacterized protein n=1 Tax=Lomentospora prolificans TaxID=41688 RepID=A0A2N3N892_9PEZI|nr:hypothetical protein jhhlp_005037 [Lomentospora prolificans]
MAALSSFVNVQVGYDGGQMTPPTSATAKPGLVLASTIPLLNFLERPRRLLTYPGFNLPGSPGASISDLKDAYSAFLKEKISGAFSDGKTFVLTTEERDSQLW